MKKTIFATACCLAAFTAAPASAQNFTSTFENLPGGPAPGSFTTVATADGWTGAPNIELQNNVAGAPAPTGGSVFVELDTSANSSMFRTIGLAGLYNLSFLYSPRPNQLSSTNGIEVLLDGTVLSTSSATGGANTSWSTISLNPFTAMAGSTLTFRAAGTSDSFGGYVDNISLAAVPEPASWAMMIGGFGAVGFSLRTRRRRQGALAIA